MSALTLDFRRLATLTARSRWFKSTSIGDRSSQAKEERSSDMKLPMMLRTTTQRGLLPSAALRSIPARTVATPALRLGPSESWRQSSRSIPARAHTIPSLLRSFKSSSVAAQPTAKYSASPLSDGEYHKLSNQAIDSLTETFETLLEDADIDALEQEARAGMQGTSRGSPSSEWDIECAVSTSPRSRRLIRCDHQDPALGTHH